MDASLLLSLLLSLHLHLAVRAAMDSCYDDEGRPNRCMPKFENVAFNRTVVASNVCGSPPEDYCMQTGSTRSCHVCDAADPERSHNVSLLTDFNRNDEPTWWQSQSMYYGIQHPNSVNLTLHLGKAFEITYIRLKFYTSRPESFAIYKRTEEDGSWLPYQYYSASCRKTYGKDAKGYIRPGDDERIAVCTDEFSDISPLTGGNVAFSTLEGRPSAYNFDKSLMLQEWVTASDLLISLDRLNTFGDEFFKDSKVLRSYFYAISDFSVGGRCKCNGHASECTEGEHGGLACACQHNTEGADCQRCRPFYQDRPWARATGDSANECLKCNCSGRSDECVFDAEQYRSTGSGGRCLSCRDNTDGPHCESCRENHYRNSPEEPCLPCNCNVNGSVSLQCDAEGRCVCRDGVTGEKCDTCRAGFHSLGPGGCRPCECDPSGSVDSCSPLDGRCFCKPNVEGQSCDRCRPGFFNLQQVNPAGCQPCFCFGHSLACSSSHRYAAVNITSDFLEGIVCGSAAINEVFLQPGTLLVMMFFLFSPFFFFFFYSVLSFHRLHEIEGRFKPSLSAFEFQHLLYNLTALKISNAGGHNWVTLTSAFIPSGPASPAAPWVESCSCPLGFTGQFCERCLSGFTREDPSRGPLSPCVPCNCHQHGSCHPETGVCECSHFTAGVTCERCLGGYHGNALIGTPGDCRPCPCPDGTSCAQIAETGQVVCTDCPAGQTGTRCQMCEDGYYGDPLGQSGPARPCARCDCNGNVDLNAVGVCDRVTGRCLKCLGHTEGDDCQRCRRGFYGDARVRTAGPKCRPCSCSPAGTAGRADECHPQTGNCLCLGHVTGRDCGRCEVGFFNLQPGIGCEICDGCTQKPNPSWRYCISAFPQVQMQPDWLVIYGLPSNQRAVCVSCRSGGEPVRFLPCGLLWILVTRLQRYSALLQASKLHCVPSSNPLIHPLIQITHESISNSSNVYFLPPPLLSPLILPPFRPGPACDCDPMGSVSMQCHSNGTCHCRQGFVGYKCDKCELNYFHDRETHQCEECPACYGLVKKQVSPMFTWEQFSPQWFQKQAVNL
uniref:Laminin, gamma 3 n=1 Tax=Salarias fasciatus TaxID=181472 RepID=A0A672HJQ3_SALFA